MKRLLIAGALALATCTGLSGCVSHPAGSPAAAITPAQAAQRTMLAAETAYNVAATAELDAKGAGLLKGDNAVRADAIRKQAYQVLLGLRSTYSLGKTPDAAALLTLTNQLLALAGQPIPTVAAPIVPTL